MACDHKKTLELARDGPAHSTPLLIMSDTYCSGIFALPTVLVSVPNQIVLLAE
jgi:hypothetical protein